MRRYTIVLDYDPETHSYGVSIPALPGCFSVGKTVEEAKAHAREAIELYLEDVQANGEPIPEDVQFATVEVAA